MESNSKNHYGLRHLTFGKPSEHEFFLVPGICLSHEMFTTTYDIKGVSWVDLLVRRGFCVHVLDWQEFHPPAGEHFGASISRLIADFIENNNKPCTLVTHSTSGAYGWKVLEHTDLIKSLVALAPAPFGNIQKNFPVDIDTSEVIFKSGEYTYHINSVDGFTPDLLWVQEKLVGHAPKFPEQRNEDLLRICVPCDPRAILERFNANESQLKIDEQALSSRKNCKVFVVTGDFDPPHPYATDNAIVEELNRIGVPAEFVWLADYDLRGHGHMFTMENGSGEILELVLNKVFGRGTVQNMGSSTEKAFKGDSEITAIKKTYKESVGVFSKAITTRLSYGGIPTNYESIADFGSHSGGFLGNLLGELNKGSISFKRIYALELDRDVLVKNISATNKIACDLAKVPVENDLFDVSVARYVLQWNSLKRQSEIIREIARTTKNFAVIQHPTVELSGQTKFHEIFKGHLISKLKRLESFYSTKEELELIFKESGLNFELADSEKIDDVSDIFIERYELNQEESKFLKDFLGDDDWWDRMTWIIWK